MKSNRTKRKNPLHLSLSLHSLICTRRASRTFINLCVIATVFVLILDENFFQPTLTDNNPFLGALFSIPGAEAGPVLNSQNPEETTLQDKKNGLEILSEEKENQTEKVQYHPSQTEKEKEDIITEKMPLMKVDDEKTDIDIQTSNINAVG